MRIEKGKQSNLATLQSNQNQNIIEWKVLVGFLGTLFMKVWYHTLISVHNHSTHKDHQHKLSCFQGPLLVGKLVN